MPTSEPQKVLVFTRRRGTPNNDYENVDVRPMPTSVRQLLSHLGQYVSPIRWSSAISLEKDRDTNCFYYNGIASCAGNELQTEKQIWEALQKPDTALDISFGTATFRVYVKTLPSLFSLSKKRLFTEPA